MPVEVPLSRGLVALVDEADAALVLAYRWHATLLGRHAYAVREPRPGDGRSAVRMHRFILAAKPGQFVDHRDGDGLNNTRANLRFASNSQNQANRRRSERGGAPYKGVRQVSRTGFGATIGGLWLGVFPSAEMAARAYDVAARARYGAFAALNFPDPGERSALTGLIIPGEAA